LLKTTKEYNIKIATAKIKVLASPIRARIVVNDDPMEQRNRGKMAKWGT
jgi:hypothetical protein